MVDPCWIVCTPRSGSTYLAHLLNHTDLFFPPFDEYLSFNRLPNYASFMAAPPPFCKALHVQFNRLFYGTGEPLAHPILNEFQTMYPDVKARMIAESKLPRLRYILLYRRDLIKQTVSYYIATKANEVSARSFFFIDNEHKQREMLAINIPKDEALLQSIWKVVQGYTSIWDQFLDGTPFFGLCYEDLAARPAKGLGQALEFLGADTTGVAKAVNRAATSLYRAAGARQDVQDYYDWAKTCLI